MKTKIRVNLTGYRPILALVGVGWGLWSLFGFLPPEKASTLRAQPRLSDHAIPLSSAQLGIGLKAVAGLYEVATGAWYIDNNGNGLWEGCGVDSCMSAFGGPGYVPLVGDWNGDRWANVGLYYPPWAAWYLDANGNGAWEGCGVDR
ncbi:MAG: hypothetical protein RMK16_05240, partial [Acidobacteriota bacterium]|nr:hypothetical protein [Acidobacteriota bacterium]